MKAVAYIRVSTEKQAGEDQVSLSEQENDIGQYCQGKGYELLQVYRDAGYSGASKRRPAFQQMLKDAQAGLFDVIVCWKSDRLSRGLYPATALMEVIDGTEIKLEAVKDTIDLNTFGIMAAVGKIELENIRTRGRMGQRGRAARDILSGTLKYGYLLGHDRRPEVHPEESEIVKRIFAWRAQGIGSWEIARRLNAEGILTRKGVTWDDTKLWFILLDPIYTGKGIYGRRQYYTRDNGDRDVRKTRWMPKENWIEVQYPQIIDEWTWQQAHIHIKNSIRERVTGKPKPVYLLQGLLWCDHCQGMYTMATDYAYKYRRQPDGTRKLERTSRLVKKYVCGKGKSLHGGCPRRYISAPAIEGKIWRDICRVFQDREWVEALAQERKRQLEEGGVMLESRKIRDRLGLIEEERTRTLYQHQRGWITDAELDIRMQGIVDTMEYSQHELARLEAEARNLNQTLEFLEDLQAVSLVLPTG